MKNPTTVIGKELPKGTTARKVYFSEQKRKRKSSSNPQKMGVMERKRNVPFISFKAERSIHGEIFSMFSALGSTPDKREEKFIGQQFEPVVVGHKNVLKEICVTTDWTKRQEGVNANQCVMLPVMQREIITVTEPIYDFPLTENN